MSKKVLSVALTLALILSITPQVVQAGDPSEPVILKAEKIQKKPADPYMPQSPPPPPPSYSPKKKKPIPVFLQPFEFVGSAIVHAIFFWKTGDELGDP